MDGGGGGAGGGPMGRGLLTWLVVDSEPTEVLLEVADVSSAEGDRFASLAFSAKRARLASRAFLSASPLRIASSTAVDEGDDAGEDAASLASLGEAFLGWRATLPEVEGTDSEGPAPRRPRTSVQSPWSGFTTSPGGEVCVAVLEHAGVACCGVVGTFVLDSLLLATNLSPND